MVSVTGDVFKMFSANSSKEKDVMDGHVTCGIRPRRLQDVLWRLFSSRIQRCMHEL